MRFILKVELGNEAMQTAEDVAALLLAAHDQLLTRCGGFEVLPASTVPHLLRDSNGNTVGKWEVTA